VITRRKFVAVVPAVLAMVIPARRAQSINRPRCRSIRYCDRLAMSVYIHTVSSSGDVERSRLCKAVNPAHGVAWMYSSDYEHVSKVRGRFAVTLADERARAGFDAWCAEQTGAGAVPFRGGVVSP